MNDAELFDAEPPPSPPRQDLLEEAVAEAKSILDDTGVMQPERMTLLKKGVVADKAGVEDWIYRLKRDSTAFQIKFSTVVMKHERGGFEDDTGSIRSLMSAIGALKQFERNNPRQDSSSAKAIGF